MPEVREEVVNVKLAEILSRDFSIDCRAERVRSGRRPDIVCYYRGLTIGIEASYDKRDAERDAERRIEQDALNVVLALWIKERYRDVPEPKLGEALRRSRFGVKVFVPRGIRGTLLQYLERGVKVRAEPVTGWFDDVDLPMVKTVIESSVSFLIMEEEIQRLLEDIKTRFREFTNALSSLDRDGTIRRNLYERLYKLYGLSIAEAQDPDVAFGHAALSIMLSAVFYEHVRDVHPELKPLTDYIRSYGPIEGLRRALEELLKVGYRVAVELAIEILKALPPGIAYKVRDLVDLAIKIASDRDLLRMDFAGRVYHEVTGDIALRKGFATFYTEVPAAYLLASLAVSTLLGLDVRSPLNLSRDEARGILSRIGSVKVGDLACGSGTLLTASYSTLMRVASTLRYYYGIEDVDLGSIGKRLIEEGIYGIDALRYASQITAVNLALVGPSTISRENVYTIYLGYIPERRQAWLGSLELLNSVGRVGGLLAYIEGGLRGVAERVALEGTEGRFYIPEGFDLVIMNPPFTRATGRGKEFGGERGLFGFVADERARKELRKAYGRVVSTVQDDLRRIAKASAGGLPNVIRYLVVNEPEELDQYLTIANAGEGLLFLYLAYRYTKEGGVIAFVLPKNLLAGALWFLARTLLASKFHVRYVIVSSDPVGGYNFSEGTSLSEVLLVATRVDRHEDSEETVFVNLLRKPTTALEAVMLAEEVMRRAHSSGHPSLVEVGQSRALVYRVRRRQLLEYIDNWNRLAAVADVELLSHVLHLLESGELPYAGVRVPLAWFNDLVAAIGVDSKQYRDHFSPTKAATPYPVVHGGGEAVRLRMAVRPNAYAHPRTSRAGEVFGKYSGRVLVPDRIWWDTAHVVSIYSREPVLSNIFYVVRLRVPESIRDYAEKALTLWLNTTWGLLTVLVSREETRGRWTRLKKAHWRLLKVLDVASLDAATLRRLVEVFDRYAEETPRRIPEQFNPENPDPVRLGIDRDFVKAVDPSVDGKKLEEGLLELYRHVDTAFKLWVGERWPEVP
ncbi:MAG: hypothetical protein LM564_01360 [Desulfurococcaceae archaeon]|nr:hypothetical protein [Desulfurococcaceae archaeon]